MATLARYRRLEARHALGRAPLVGLVAGLALLVATQIVMPLVPAPAIGLLEQAFRVRGLGAVVLLNDYLALSTVLFFVGVSQLLQVIVAPREERQLDLLLTKPIAPATFLAARTTPVLISTGVLGAILSVGCALAMLPYEAAGADGTALGAFGAGLVVTAATILQLAAVNVVFLRISDGFAALMVAFIVWVLPLLPASAFIYRPDLFDGSAALTTALVAPANLLWHDGAMPIVAAVGLLVAGVASATLVRLGGWTLGRMDLR
ncbi:MAG: hypothetical protein V4850_20985 [Myxococcota bacterium]